jgi:hypothetical protein
MLSKFSFITVYCVLPNMVQFLEVIAGGWRQDMVQILLLLPIALQPFQFGLGFLYN